MTGNKEQRYTILDDAEPINGVDRDSIGFVTSVSESGALGCTVGIGHISLTTPLPPRLFYRNLHWTNWRVCRVESLPSEAVYF